LGDTMVESLQPNIIHTRAKRGGDDFRLRSGGVVTGG